MTRPILPFMDFSGGLNVETSNEKLNNNECTVLQNADLSTRGSVKRRTGRTKIGSISGKGQGMFFYYREGQQEPDIIVAVSGRLYVKQGSVFNEIVILDVNNTPFTFQTTLPIEAVQYRKVLFVATGTKLVEVTYDNGFKAEVMKPYKPTVLEVINIGTNAIADDPSTWIQEKEASSVQIEGITPSIEQGSANTPIRFTAHVKKPSNVDVNYTFSTRKTGPGTFTERKTNSSENFADISFDDIGGYDIKVDTKTVVYPVSTWDVNHEGWVNGIRGNTWDSSDNEGCLVLQGTAVNPNDPTLKSWKDFSTPLDMSGADRIDWWFSVVSSDTFNGLDPESVQIKFYTEGNLTTPILTISNTGGKGRALYNAYRDDPVPIPGNVAWRKETSNYDGSKSGMNKIVRIGVSGGKVDSNGNYVPNSGNWDFSPDDTTSRFDDIIIYKSGTEVSYTMTDYQIVGVTDPSKDPETYSAIHTSRSIHLHWDRLILAKDNKYPGQIYISDLNNPRYFPTNKRIDFSLDRQEGITAITRFKDFLVIFTKTTISILLGKGPQDGEIPLPDTYSIRMIHDRIGCIADRSAQVVGNEIFFLGDDGLYTLRPNEYQLNDLNVQRIDDKVKSLVTRDTNACAVVFDNQYWICFPSKKEILRMYYQTGAWVQDKSTKLNLSQFLLYTDDAYNLTDNGTVYIQDKNTYADDGDIYDLIVESKYIDLQSSFDYKKLRRLFVLANYYDDHSVPLYVKVYADAQIVLNPTVGKAVEVNGYVEWQSTTEPNMHFYSSTRFGNWIMGQGLLGHANIFVNEAKIRGKCRRAKISFHHNQNHLTEIYGFGVEFKYKKA